MNIMQENEPEVRMSDLKLQDELSLMSDRLFGLEAAIETICDSDVPQERGVRRLAGDIADGMAKLAEAFEAERQRRMAEKGKA
jgi:hypothetical protein